jgi:hypothetical protein
MNKLRHPCAQTCSGYQQGYEEGTADLRAELERVTQEREWFTELVANTEAQRDAARALLQRHLTTKFGRQYLALCEETRKFLGGEHEAP